MSQSPQEIIKSAIAQIEEIKKSKAVGVDPKWMNRTLSHLDNAYAASTLIVRAGSLADSPEAQSAMLRDCTCPFPDTVDENCPVHGQK